MMWVIFNIMAQSSLEKKACRCYQMFGIFKFIGRTHKLDEQNKIHSKVNIELVDSLNDIV